MEWVDAWNIVKNCCAYTNHTILAEALEKWPVHIFKNLLPRIYTIVEEINRRLVIEISATYGTDSKEVKEMAIIKDDRIHMANLAIAGSFSVNGVAELHTNILKNSEMKTFNEYYPGKFNNKTNGVTHRRWLLHSNPELVSILNDTVGSDWVKYPDHMENLVKYVCDKKIQSRYYDMKLARKKSLAKRIFDTQGIEINPDSIFDVHVKRLHEYRRPLLSALHIMYRAIFYFGA